MRILVTIGFSALLVGVFSLTSFGFVFTPRAKRSIQQALNEIGPAEWTVLSVRSNMFRSNDYTAQIQFSKDKDLAFELLWDPNKPNNGCSNEQLLNTIKMAKRSLENSRHLAGYLRDNAFHSARARIIMNDQNPNWAGTIFIYPEIKNSSKTDIIEKLRKILLAWRMQLVQRTQLEENSNLALTILFFQPALISDKDASPALPALYRSPHIPGEERATYSIYMDKQTLTSKNQFKQAFNFYPWLKELDEWNKSAVNSAKDFAKKEPLLERCTIDTDTLPGPAFSDDDMNLVRFYVGFKRAANSGDGSSKNPMGRGAIAITFNIAKHEFMNFRVIQNILNPDGKGYRIPFEEKWK